VAAGGGECDGVRVPRLCRMGADIYRDRDMLRKQRLTRCGGRWHGAGQGSKRAACPRKQGKANWLGGNDRIPGWIG
jgi:hypothetical protein